MMPAPVRPRLLWALGATVAASAVAWLWPSPPTSPKAPAPQTWATTGSMPSPRTAAGTGPQGAGFADAAGVSGLPAELPATAWAPAQRDIFALAPSAPPAPVPAAALETSSPRVAAGPAPAPAAPSPAAPALAWRYLGGMALPDGRLQVLLANGSREVTAVPGQPLGDGFEIRRISSTAIHLVHAASGTEHDIALPMPLTP